MRHLRPLTAPVPYLFVTTTNTTGTGAVTQTVVLKGSFDSDGASPTDLCTITLSGTA